jgi:hypothetical protein
MIRTAFLAVVALIALSLNAEARPRHHHVHHDARPSAWCGWQMRQWLHVADIRGNLARWWAGYGSRAEGPAVGTIVVWPHHVGRIVGHSSAGWIVQSGNDGHRIRTRPRSVSRAIAFRWPYGHFASLNWN